MPGSWYPLLLVIWFPSCSPPVLHVFPWFLKRLYSVIFLSESVYSLLYVYISICMVSLPSAYSADPISVFLAGSSLDDLLFWVSSSSASCWISRSISGGYYHCLLVFLLVFPLNFWRLFTLLISFTVFQFSLKLDFYGFCFDYEFSLYSILPLFLC